MNNEDMTMGIEYQLEQANYNEFVRGGGK